MKNSTTQRCHYLNEENVPLSVAIREAIAAHQSPRPVAENEPFHGPLDVEAVDALFTEAVAREEGVSMSLRLTLRGTRVDVRTDPTPSDDPVRIDVAEIDE